METKTKVIGLLTVVIIVLAIVVFFVILDSNDSETLSFDNETYNSLEEQMCKSIRGTPSWVDQEGKILLEGYADFGNISQNIVRERLIPNKIYFLYLLNCIWCERQIEGFGLQWEDYKQSGYTVDCSEHLK